MYDYSIVHVERIPGERMYIDWVGNYPELLTDPATREICKVHAFAITLGFSRRVCTEIFPDEKLPNFIAGIVHALEYYRVVPKNLVPNNLNTAVSKRWINPKFSFSFIFLQGNWTQLRLSSWQPAIGLTKERTCWLSECQTWENTPKHYLVYLLFASWKQYDISEQACSCLNWSRPDRSQPIWNTLLRCPNLICLQSMTSVSWNWIWINVTIFLKWSTDGMDADPLLSSHNFRSSPWFDLFREHTHVDIYRPYYR